MKNHYLVSKDNNLIEARQNKPLTVTEQKIILTMVSMIEPKDEEFKDYDISVKDFLMMLNLPSGGSYNHIKKVVDELLSKVVEIPSTAAAGGWVKTHWVSSAEYVNGSGTIQLRFAPKLKPYLIQLKDTFTSYRLNNILSLKSGYSIRLYELMKKWQRAGEWTCTLESLREKLGVGAQKYPRYANFNARILKVSVAELNEKTDLNITVNEIRKGRNLEKLSFIIKSKAAHQPPKPKELTSVDHLRSRLNERASGYKFDTVFFSNLYQAASLIWAEKTEKELNWLVDYVNDESSIKNPLGFIKSKITSAWEFHEVGQSVTFADLRPTIERRSVREEKLPEWFNKPEEPVDPSPVDPSLAVEKEKLLAKLAEKKKKKDSPSTE